MLLRKMDFVAIDFETTGVCPGFHEEPWQIGMVYMSRGRVEPQYAYNRLLKIDPSRPFNPYVPGRHASLRHILAESVPLSALWQELAPWLSGRTLLAHNVPVEQRILKQAFPMHALGPWIDTLVLARRCFPSLKSYKLSDLIPEFGLLETVKKYAADGEPHDAFYDAMACAVLFEYMLTLPCCERLMSEDRLF